MVVAAEPGRTCAAAVRAAFPAASDEVPLDHCLDERFEVMDRVAGAAGPARASRGVQLEALAQHRRQALVFRRELFRRSTPGNVGRSGASLPLLLLL
jgi:hypothetical protein